MSTQIFFHICCINHWKQIVRDSFLKIIYSGLYDKVDSIHCFLVNCTSQEDIDYVLEFGTKIKVISESSTGHNESFTLSRIPQYLLPDSKFLYIHSKGVTRNTTRLKIDGVCDTEVSTLPQNIMDWKDVMEYHLIAKHEECLQLLDTYDALGINFFGNGCPPHFSGNMWWSTSSYYSTLDLTRERTEDLILSNPQVQCKELFSTGHQGYGHYIHRYPFRQYLT